MNHNLGTSYRMLISTIGTTRHHYRTPLFEKLDINLRLLVQIIGNTSNAY